MSFDVEPLRIDVQDWTREGATAYAQDLGGSCHMISCPPQHPAMEAVLAKGFQLLLAFEERGSAAVLRDEGELVTRLTDSSCVSAGVSSGSYSVHRVDVTHATTLCRTETWTRAARAVLRRPHARLYAGAQEPARAATRATHRPVWGDLPIHIVNLERRRDRLTSCLDSIEDAQAMIDESNVPLALLPVRINALDAKDQAWMQQEIKGLNGVREEVTESDAELACCTSHIRGIQEAYAAGEEYALIVEDDSDLRLLGEFAESLLALLNAPATQGFDVIQLCWMELTWGFEGRRGRRPWYVPPGGVLIYKSQRAALPWHDRYFCGGCYLVRRSGMERIVSKFGRLGEPVDYWPRLREEKAKGGNVEARKHGVLVADHLIFHTCSTITSTTPYSTVGWSDSDLRSDEQLRASHFKYYIKNCSKALERRRFYAQRKREALVESDECQLGGNARYLVFLCVRNGEFVLDRYRDFAAHGIRLVICCVGCSPDRVAACRSVADFAYELNEAGTTMDAFAPFYWGYKHRLRSFTHIGLFDGQAWYADSLQVRSLMNLCASTGVWIGSGRKDSVGQRDKVRYEAHIVSRAPVIEARTLDLLMHHFPSGQLSQSTVDVWMVQMLDVGDAAGHYATMPVALEGASVQGAESDDKFNRARAYLRRDGMIGTLGETRDNLNEDHDNC